MSDHTQGPWLVDEEDGFILQQDGDRLWIASVIGIPAKMGGEKAEKANGRLLAAAPELLEACKDSLIYLAHEANGLRPARIVAAIAKAEGP